jgi:hypothetical protein
MMKINWGTGILLFIILFLLLCVAAVVFSLRQNNDLVEKDYYDKGADFSNQIEINKRSSDYSDSISVYNFDNKIVIKTTHQMASTADSFMVYFFRPSDKEKDLKIEFKSSCDSMMVEKSRLAHGRYLVKLSWKKGNGQYMIEKDIFVN